MGHDWAASDHLLGLIELIGPHMDYGSMRPVYNSRFCREKEAK